MAGSVTVDDRETNAHWKHTWTLRGRWQLAGDALIIDIPKESDMYEGEFEGVFNYVITWREDGAFELRHDPQSFVTKQKKRHGGNPEIDYDNYYYDQSGRGHEIFRSGLLFKNKVEIIESPMIFRREM